MANKVNTSPRISSSAMLASLTDVARAIPSLARDIVTELRLYAIRLNNSLQVDGSEGMTGPLKLNSYTVAALPDATTNVQGVIYVSNETGGAVLAFSDGTNWRRVTDRAVVS